MIYSNKSYPVEEIKLANSTIKGFCLATSNTGRRLILPTVSGLDEIPEERTLKEYTLGRSQTNLPRIDRVKPNDKGDLYLILSAQGLEIGLGNGRIMAPDGTSYDLISKQINDNGNIAWSVAIIRARNGNIFRIVPSGYANNSGASSQFYIVHNGKVFSKDQPDIEFFYQEQGLPLPKIFKRHPKGNRLIIEAKEWHKI